MKKEELNSLLESIKVKFKKPNYSSSSSDSVMSNISGFELGLFKYFLEKNIDTIYILYTNAIFQPAIHMGLCISFPDEMSFNTFQDKWGKWISDTSCYLKKIKKDRNTGNYTAISIILYGNSLKVFGSLLESELETEILNKTH
jgi:hypothetical protein